MGLVASYNIIETDNFREKLLSFSKKFDHYCFLDSCGNSIYGELRFDYLLAAGRTKYIEASSKSAIDEVRSFFHNNNNWCFGFAGYDLKNGIENLTSHHPDNIGFPDTVFFIPEILVKVNNNIAEILVNNGTALWENCLSVFNSIQHQPINFNSLSNQIDLRTRFTKQEYIDVVEKIREHIIEGDIYEMNLCQEFYAENVQIDSHFVFNALCKTSKAPFSVLFKWDNKFLISASPERFLKRTGNRIQAQPIKGTLARSAVPEEDAKLKIQLSASEKDRAENVMIVDLMRNDLARISKTGTIKVDELFGIYSFEHVHQMVSTISSELKDDIDLAEIFIHTFPMGSMTGAPKIMAMQLIEQYERTKRGLFSGAFGYITPEGNFDFNVVIRSILYNTLENYLSVSVGGAIVYDSIAEMEYEECLSKLMGIKDILKVTNPE